MNDIETQSLELNSGGLKRRSSLTSEAYLDYYLKAWSRIRSFLSPEEEKAARKQSEECFTLFRKFGYLLELEYLALLRVNEETLERDKLFFTISFFAALFALGTLAALGLNSVTLTGILSPILVYAPYRQYVANRNVVDAKIAYEATRRDIELLKYDIEMLNNSYQASSPISENLSILLLYNNRTKNLPSGLADPTKRPNKISSNSRSYDSLVAALGIDINAASDPRWPNVHLVILCKTLIAAARGATALDMYEVEKGFLQDFNYIPTHDWDYPDFIRSYEANEIKGLK
ncbi:hypothetical protein OE810_13240 [Rhodobacteraceae bacterium XHP0102]|nr:hypothetical protein [Rhodobacteraceae bacterium XHP0102]